MPGIFDSLGPSLIQTGIQFGAGLAQSRIQQGRAENEQNQAVEAAWDQLIAEALAIIQGISDRPNVTAADVNDAAAVIAAIEQWLAQNGTARVRQQWNDPDYKPAFMHSLDVLRNRAMTQGSGAGQGPGAGGDSQSSVLSPQSWFDSPYVPIALVIAAALLLKRSN